VAQAGEEIAGIAVIARHRRDRKSKSLPRRHGDAEGIGGSENRDIGKAKIGTTQVTEEHGVNKRLPKSPKLKTGERSP
jgi:hypothetical protein